MEPIREIKGGNIVEFVGRAAGYAPSKEEHAELVTSLKKESVQLEKEIKHKKKQQKKINTDILRLTSRLRSVDGEIQKSKKIVESILGGKRRRKRTTKKMR
jgi:septal ring factor EnvC (AmiA/AmiB activator)